MNRKERRQRRIARRQERRSKQQQAFTEPLTGRRAQKISKAQANLAYRPTERQIGREVRGSRMQQGRVGSWYNQFARQLEESRAQTQAAYAQAQQNIAGTMQAAGTADTQRQAQLQSAAQQRQALTGAPADTAGPQARAEAARQSGLFGAALAAPVAAQGANAFAYSTNEANISRRQGIEARMDERRRRQEMKSDLRALRKEKGAYRVDKLNELRQGERDYGIQRAAFNLDKQNARMDARQAALDRAADDRRNREDNAQDERASVRSSQNTGGNGGMTPTQRRNARREQKSANITAWNLYQAAKNPPSTPQEWAAFTQLIASEDGIDAAAAKKAVNRLRKKLRSRSSGGGPARGKITGPGS